MKGTAKNDDKRLNVRQGREGRESIMGINSFEMIRATFVPRLPPSIRSRRDGMEKRSHTLNIFQSGSPASAIARTTCSTAGSRMTERERRTHWKWKLRSGRSDEDQGGETEWEF
jgi:hypothetical protein